MRKNPVENVRQIVVELTTRCNFSCAHCYNAGVARVTESDLASLSAALDAFLDLGVREIAFIGGEVTKYGYGWLDLASRVGGRGAAMVAVLSNGWFLGQSDFEAAGRRYRDDRTYLADLRAHGVTHIGFSLDGREAVHDASRGMPGLYRRVIAGFGKAREAGLKPRVALLSREGEDLDPLVRELSPLLYPDGSGSIWFDRTNIVSNMIDLRGGAGSGGETPYGLGDTPRTASAARGSTARLRT